jgi:hypothetical protein
MLRRVLLVPKGGDASPVEILISPEQVALAMPIMHDKYGWTTEVMFAGGEILSVIGRPRDVFHHWVSALPPVEPPGPPTTPEAKHRQALELAGRLTE